MNWKKESTNRASYEGIWDSAENYLNFLNNKTNNIKSVLYALNSPNIFEGSNLSVLDLGCGMSWTSAMLKSKFPDKIKDIDLYDGDETFGRLSRDMFQLWNIEYNDVNFITGNFDNIGFIKKKYDIIIMTSAIHHVYELDKLIGDIYLLLKTDGIFLILNENPIPHFKFTWYLLKNYLHDIGCHFFRPKYFQFKQISHCGIKYDPTLGDYFIPLRRYEYLLDVHGFSFELLDSGLKQYTEMETDHTLKHFICRKRES